MSEVFFTSDLHFGHNKDFIYKARGYNSIDEMNESIIEKFNSIVKDNDTIYILGDCIVGTPVEEGTQYIKRLHGHKFLCIGNHDSDAKLKYWIQNNTFEAYEFAYRFRYNKWGFYCTHFPTLVGNYDNPKWCGLYGHTHQKENWSEDWQTANMYNVGVDANNCLPVHLDEVLTKIKKQIHITKGGNSYV